MKKIFLLFTIFFASLAYAQIPSGRYFYCRSGETFESAPFLFVALLYDGDGKFYGDSRYSVGSIKADLKKNPDKYKTPKDFGSGHTGGYYSSASSTSNYYVYEYSQTFSTGELWMDNQFQTHTRTKTIVVHCAFSKDLTSLIVWEDDDTSNRKYYTRVDESLLLPQAANYDFLR